MIKCSILIISEPFYAAEFGAFFNGHNEDKKYLFDSFLVQWTVE